MGASGAASGKAGRAIRRWCRERGVSQAELARRAGYTRGYVSLVIRGYRPAAVFAEAIERATGGEIRASELLPA